MSERNKFTDLQIKWLEALESNAFPQIKMNLVEMDDDGNRCNGMCCLGVATHTVDPGHFALKQNGWDRHEWANEHDLYLDEIEQYGDDECTAPPDVVDALFLESSEGGFRFLSKHKDQRSLIGLNDKAGLTFPKIAAFIREKPWLVFTNFDMPKVAA